MKIIIGTEGKGIFAKKIVNYLLENIYQDIQIEYNNIQDCNLIVRSHFLNQERPWNRDNNKKYIYWSGESFLPMGNYKHKNVFFISTNIINNVKNHIYIPYFLFSPYLYKEKINNENKKYLLIYCNTNKIKEREELFNTFVEKTNSKICHSYGSCYGKYKETNKGKISGNWENEELIKVYSKYKFAIAMENKCVDGYITEKILNAYYSGCIPIYWGSKNINDFFNPESFINVNDFKSIEDCVDYIINLSEKEINIILSKPFYNENNYLLNILKEDTKDNLVLKIYKEKLLNFLNK